MRYLISIEYRGTRFRGWEKQPGLRTVRGTLEAALSLAFGAPISLRASGRTDAGAHAEAQKAHFDCSGRIPPERLPQAANALLPDDVCIRDATRVADSFDARRDAKSKTYRYDFHFGRVPRPLTDEFAAWVRADESAFDPSRARAVLKKLVGTHDFSAFESTGRPVKSAVRTIYSASLSEKSGLYSIFVTGNGFLYNMVRIAAGTAIEAGLGRCDVAAVDSALATGDRRLCARTYPAKGLTLSDVSFDMPL